jgi:hydroxymethylglutaryl-CoA lyase
MSDSRVQVCEVGPRDGLQILQQVVPTDNKLRLIKGLAAAGVSDIEVGSFVPPKLLPQMADTATVVAEARKIPGLKVTTLVPNAKGAELAFASSVDKVIVPLSASREHSLANVRKEPDAMIDEVRKIVALRQTLPECKTKIVLGIGTAFGCAIQGEVPEKDVVRFAEAAAEAGADAISLGDTVGYANPEQVRRIIRSVQDRVGEKLKECHFHDTRGLALANTVVALDCGIRQFDSSIGGLGGCPFAPGATGNVATEDLVFMLNAMGYQTGISVERLLELRNTVLQSILPGETLWGVVHRAGVPKTYKDAAHLSAA